MPTSYPLSIESCEQEILKQIKSVIGDKSVSEAKLHFAPSWILEKTKKKEYANYMDSVQVVSRSRVPRSANIVFNVKYDGETGKLKLECRIVPHGNRDERKDKILSDSSTAQFPIIRTALSIAALYKFKLATLDISKAYLQAGALERDIYMRPPAFFMSKPGELLKLLKSAYGLVESGRLWQMTVEPWLLNTYGFETIPGLPQLFVLKSNNGSLQLIVAKVVDDFLLAGLPSEISRFHRTIAKRFQSRAIY